MENRKYLQSIQHVGDVAIKFNQKCNLDNQTYVNLAIVEFNLKTDWRYIASDEDDTLHLHILMGLKNFIFGFKKLNEEGN